MKAELIFKQKAKFDGYIREMIIWRINDPVVISLPKCKIVDD
jgi:hypothetical protein